MVVSAARVTGSSSCLPCVSQRRCSTGRRSVCSARSSATVLRQGTQRSDEPKSDTSSDRGPAQVGQKDSDTNTGGPSDSGAEEGAAVAEAAAGAAALGRSMAAAHERGQERYNQTRRGRYKSSTRMNMSLRRSVPAPFFPRSLFPLSNSILHLSASPLARAPLAAVTDLPSECSARVRAERVCVCLRCVSGSRTTRTSSSSASEGVEAARLGLRVRLAGAEKALKLQEFAPTSLDELRSRFVWSGPIRVQWWCRGNFSATDGYAG